MTYVVHDTPGLIDVRAFTTFGVNAKPGAASPIGYFGTGLKYAVAVLCREGCEISVWIGEDEHVFYGQKIDFRGKELLQLRMRRRRGVTARMMSTELPYTTELGKNWKVWMALRELHSNTLDEGGATRLVEGDAGDQWPPHPGDGDRTRIVVRGEAYVDAARRLDELFLPEASRDKTTGVDVYWRPSAYAYYRGLRAADLQYPAVLTYDFRMAMELTEDRTLKYGFMLEYYVRCQVMASTDKALIERVLRADDDTFEGHICWDESAHTLASPEFLAGVRLWGRRRALIVLRAADAAAAPQRPVGAWYEQVRVALQDRSLTEQELGRVVRQHSAALLTALAREAVRARANEVEDAVQNDSDGGGANEESCDEEPDDEIPY